MVTIEDFEHSLESFYVKVNIFGIRFRDDREKNMKALKDLELSPLLRKKVVMSLTWHDYSEGPIIDKLNSQGEMWVFGKDVKGVEVYIKISLGSPNSRTICISFHQSDFPMIYPLKFINNGKDDLNAK